MNRVLFQIGHNGDHYTLKVNFDNARKYVDDIGDLEKWAEGAVQMIREHCAKDIRDRLDKETPE